MSDELKIVFDFENAVQPPPVGKRHVYNLKWAGQGGVDRWHWKCVCGFETGLEHERDESQRQADAHRCDDGSAKLLWCAMPHRMHQHSLAGQQELEL